MSGNDSHAAQAVFDHLYALYLSRIPVDRTEILWSGPFFIALFAVVLIGFFLLLAFRLRNVGARDNKLLELTTFAGHLTERVGRISVFNLCVWTVIVVWAAYFAVKQIVFGMGY